MRIPIYVYIDYGAYIFILMKFSSDNVGIDANQRVRIEKLQEFSMYYIKSYLKQKQQKQQQQQDSSVDDSPEFNRVLKLLVKMNILRALEPDLIEDLFFTNLIGPVQIETVIPHILNLGNINA